MTDENASRIPAMRTPEQARNYADDVCTTLETARLTLDLSTDVKEQRALYAKFLVRQGYVTGVLDVLVGCGLLTETGYEELRRRALRTMLPSAARGIVVAGAIKP